MRRTINPRVLGVGVLLLATLVACTNDSDSSSAGPSTTTATDTPTTLEVVERDDLERFPTTDWLVGEPADHGMDEAKLNEALAYAAEEGHHTQGVVVVRHGAVVGEWYAPGSDADSWAASWSMAKSITSALIGIAIDEGLIPSVDEPMTTYFPEWEGTDKEAITLRDVLEMASGLAWNENYTPDPEGNPSDIIAIVTTQADQLAYVAGLPLDVEPGTRWSYSSGDTMLLSAVLQQVTGVKVSDYAKAKLFDPIGIDQVEWWEDAAGHTLTYCCVDTTSRDFARFGLLFLRDGNWDGTQVVPADWVEASVAPSPAYPGYGFQWWLGTGGGALPDDTFQASGFDGQSIWVIPSLDLVVVRNGTYVKSPDEPVADPTLFTHYPAGGYVAGKGTRPPEGSWSGEEFLGTIVASITG